MQRLGYQKVDVCAPAFRPAIGNRPASPQAISDTLRDMLISSVACGDARLALAIAGNFDTISCLARIDSCSQPDVQFVRLQVGLADFALDAARGLIDEVKTRGTGSGETHFRGTSYRDAEASKRSQGTSFFKSRANSANNFARTSESHESSFSTSRAQADGKFTNTGADKSRRQQNAMTTSFDKATVEGKGTGAGESFYTSTRTSSAQSKTAPNPDFKPITAQSVPHVEVFGIAVLSLPRFVGVFSSTPTKPVCRPPSIDPDRPPQVCDALQPSVGAGFTSSYEVTGALSIALGPISLASGFSWKRSQSHHFRTQHVCSVGSGSVSAASRSSITYQQDDASSSSGNTKTDASGFDQHNIVRNGDSLRTSTSKLHAESTGRMDSCGESHSSAQRKAHGEAQNTGQSQSQMERHSESQVKFQSISKTLTEARYFNQIFKQLLELRKLLWERLMFSEARQRASIGSRHSCAGARTLTAPPLFYFSNAFTCSRCFSSNCKCGAR